ncbi:MAG: DMT family transporter [Actinomycetota bacterium]
MIFGLLAALGWGLSDLCAAVASRRAGSRPVTLLAQIAGLIGFAVLILFVRPSWDLPAQDVLLLLGSGTFAGVAYFALYRGLELGPIALVSPIASAFSAVTVLLAVVALGESLGGLEIVGICSTLIGVVLSSTDLRRLGVEAKRHRRGIPFGIAAMIGFGVAAFASGAYAQTYGWLPPIAISRVGSFALIVVVMLVTARKAVAARATPPLEDGLAGTEPTDSERVLLAPGDPRSRVNLALAGFVGLVDIVGIAAYARGSELGLVSITAAVSATFTLIPVLGGVTIFGERPVPNQIVGVLLVVAGLILLGVGGA